MRRGAAIPHFALKRQESSFADITPLVDMVFLLLIFLLVSSRFLKPAIALELPKASGGDQASSSSLVVSVDRKERIFLEGEMMQISQLSARLKAALRAREEAAVVLEADGGIAFAYIVKVMDQIRASGASVLNISHRPLDSPSPEPP